MDLRIKKYGASWCSPCNQQNQEFIEHPLKVEHINFDIDELEDESLENLGITSVPVIILYDGDKEVNRWEGFTESSEINSYIENYEV